MRILVYGAGVQGSVYGGLLAAAGHEITFLARGLRAAQLSEQGLVLRGALGDRNVKLPRPSLTTRLGLQDRYELCLVTVRREQVEAIIPALAASAIPMIAFMHNHADGSGTLLDRVGHDRAVIAFPGAGGAIRADGVVQYALIAEQPTMVGLWPGLAARPRAFRDLLRHAGLSVTSVRDPDAWLRRHAVMVGALTGALWRVGCDSTALIHSHDGIPDFIRAVREGFHALDAVHVAPAPLALRALFGWMPLPLSAAYWRKYLTGPRGELLFAAHARHAADEMAQLTAEVQAVMRPSGIKTPIFDRLRTAIPG
ncbi:hypothetical protein GCM10022631_26890 [Deinococcus rubellus]|uniref:ketopantoate reductase family protein n=1 Tax=Deinococcus rubellus TaxID=1889240 RepID=UPI0031E92B7A